MGQIDLFHNVLEFTKQLNGAETIDELLSNVQTYLSNLGLVPSRVMQISSDRRSAIHMSGDPIEVEEESEVYGEDLDAVGVASSIEGPLMEALYCQGKVLVTMGVIDSSEGMENVEVVPFIDIVRAMTRGTKFEHLTKKFGKQIPQVAPIKSSIMAPFYGVSGIQGAIILSGTRKNPLGKAHIELAQVIAEIISASYKRIQDNLALRRSEELIEAQKIESIGNLAGGVAHDFNNMLSGILGHASFLHQEETDEEKRKDLEAIIEASLRAADLTDKLLAFGRKGKNIVCATSLNSAAEEVLGLLRRSAPKTITWSTRLAEDLFWVDADPGQITQVVMNLCLNALEASEEQGSVEVRTSNVCLDEDFCRQTINLSPGDYVLLQVEDRGAGMDQQTMSQIFEPFFSTKKDIQSGGTGLGLSTTYGIVRNHGGMLDVTSQKGQGSCFNVYLPRGHKAPQDVEALDQNDQPDRITLLVVDDEKMVRTLLSRLGSRLGYHVITAEDGKKGLEIYRQQASEIHGVVLDMNMPVMGGRETFLEMKKINPEVRAMLSTGYGANEEAQEILDLGAVSLLSKPYDMDQLSEQLALLLAPFPPINGDRSNSFLYIHKLTHFYNAEHLCRTSANATGNRYIVFSPVS